MEQLILQVLLLAFMAITGYVIAIASKHSALKSISDSDDKLEYPYKWLFEAVILLNSAALIFSGLAYPTGIVWSWVVGGAGLSLVAIFSRLYKNTFFKVMHTIGAVVGFGSLLLSPWIDFGEVLITVAMLVVVVASAMLVVKHMKIIWILEVIIIYLVFSYITNNIIGLL